MIDRIRVYENALFNAASYVYYPAPEIVKLTRTGEILKIIVAAAQ